MTNRQPNRNPVFGKNRVSGTDSPPLVISHELAPLEVEIQAGMAELREMLQ